MAETYTFENGMQVGILRVSQNLMRELSRSFPEPKPPMIETSLGMEANPNDPDYLAALEQHREEFGKRVLDMLILRGVWVEVDKAAVEALRVDMAEVGVELEKNDKLVYVKQICVITPQDIRGLQNAILGKVQPTEPNIAAAVSEFKSTVPG